MKTKSSSSRLGPERVPPPITLSHTNQACGPRTILNIIKSGYRRWTMPEIRKDYATPTWVVFSAARSQRPGAFRNPKDATPKESCPFCEGHEAMTPPEILAYRDRGGPNGPGWSIRCVPNKFPALERVGEVREHRDGPFLSVDGVGAHEIIVESPDHDGHLATLDDRQVERVLRAYRERYHDLAADRRIKYVQIFKNHGKRAGASYSHPHLRSSGSRSCPSGFSKRGRACVRTPSSGRATACSAKSSDASWPPEGVSSPRTEGSSRSSRTQRASRSRRGLLPKVHARAFETLSDADRAALAAILKDVLGRVDRMLDDPSFNYYIHTAPVREPEGTFHWHLEITPRLTKIAGFERGTGFYINPVVPEDAAAILKGEIRWTGQS